MLLCNYRAGTPGPRCARWWCCRTATRPLVHAMATRCSILQEHFCVAEHPASNWRIYTLESVPQVSGRMGIDSSAKPSHRLFKEERLPDVRFFRSGLSTIGRSPSNRNRIHLAPLTFVPILWVLKGLTRPIQQAFVERAVKGFAHHPLFFTQPTKLAPSTKSRGTRTKCFTVPAAPVTPPKKICNKPPNQPRGG